MGSGIDTRSLGGYVLGPGSSIDGKSYEITHKAQIAPAPEWLVARLGQATGVSRVYIFENGPVAGGDVLCSRKYEWTGAGVSSLMYNPDLHDLSLRSRGFGRWIDVMSRGQVVEGHVREFPETERSILATVDVRSALVVPVFVEQHWKSGGE